MTLAQNSVQSVVYTSGMQQGMKHNLLLNYAKYNISEGRVLIY